MGATKDYGNVDKAKVNRILDSLRNSGKSVSGNNPWKIDVKQHGVKLEGSWDEVRSNLHVRVTDKNFYVPYDKIWSTIDPLIRNA